MLDENTVMRVGLCEIQGGARDGLRVITLFFHNPDTQELVSTFGMEVAAAEVFMAQIYEQVLKVKGQL